MTGWNDAFDALAGPAGNGGTVQVGGGQKDAANPLAVARDIYGSRIVPLHDRHPERPPQERQAIEARALDVLRTVGGRDGADHVYALPAYLNLRLRNPDLWTRLGDRMIPTPRLNLMIAQALDLTEAQKSNPYRPLFRGVLAHINGKDEEANRRFETAARMGGFAPIVTDCLRGASLARPLPGLTGLMQFEPVAPLAEIECLARPELAPGPVLSFCGDSVYFRAFSLSIAESLGQVRDDPVNLHFHIIASDPDDADLQRAIVVLRGFCAAQGQQLTLTIEHHPQAMRAYFATARFLRIGAFLKMFERPILMSDMDVSFTADPVPVIASQGFDSCRAVVSRGPFWGFIPWRQIWAGQILFVPNDEGHLFADILRRAACYLWRDEAHLNWWVDQYALWLAHRTMGQLGLGHALRDLTGYGDYILSSERIKIDGLRRIDAIAAAMEDGADWHAALVRSQAG